MQETAWAQLPGNVTPGAVEPQTQVPVLRAPEDEGIVAVPSPDQRAALQTEGVSIRVAEFFPVIDRPEQLNEQARAGLAAVLHALLDENNYELTFGQLQESADEATAYLRESGYLLARAVLPPQEVENAVVRMDIFIGVLGETYAIDSTLYKEKDLQKPFANQVGGAVQQSDVESALLRIRDLPGLSAVAVFRPGDEIGETALGVKVIEESSIDYSLRIDNHGLEPTGELRLLGAVAVNNITTHRDRLRVDAVKTFDSGDLRNARLNYEITESALVHTLGLGFSKTRYDVERGPARVLGIEGDTEIGDFYLRSQWLRSRTNNFGTLLGLSVKRAEVEFTAAGLNQGVDRLTVANLGVIYDGVDNRFRGLHRATLMFHRGIESFIGSMDSHGNRNSLGRVNGDEQELPGKFEKVTATYNRLQAITRNHSLLVRAAGQYSNDTLSSLEKMSLGGPYTVRAYPVAEYINDRATFASAAWVINGAAFSDANVYDEFALGDIFNLYVFADYGWGKNRNADGSVTRREIDGGGVQADFRFPDRDAYVELIAARPFGSDESDNGDDFQFWFNVGIEF